MGNGEPNGEPTCQQRSNRLRGKEDGVERTKSNNTEDADTQEDIVMGFSQLPGPHNRDTIHATQP